jgi:sporadic carbohydrate cluster protein (TIGR04323 family)
MSERLGYRGYIGSRSYFGARAPQHVQNLVARDFCARNGYRFLISATEYAMPGCYMILEDVVREAGKLDGVVCYSIFMLPMKQERRLDVVRRLFDAGATLHGAVENIHVRNDEELKRMELLWAVQAAQMPAASFAADASPATSLRGA